MASSGQLQFACTPVGYIVRIVGRGSIPQAATLRDFVNQRLQAEDSSVVVDLTQCEHLDSTFLGTLASLHRQHAVDQPRLAMFAGEQRRSQLFGCSQLDKLLHWKDAPSEPAAEWMTIDAPHLEAAEFGRIVMESHERLAELGGKDAEAFRQIADRIARELSKTTA